MKAKNKISKILRARELRKESTKAEQILWQYLRDRNLFGKKFRRQHVFHGFILDFYCPEDNLAIELDGSIHLKQKDYDLARQNVIVESGLKVLRFINKEVLTDIENVLKSIRSHLISPSPSLMEKGV